MSQKLKKSLAEQLSDLPIFVEEEEEVVIVKKKKKVKAKV